MKIEQIINEIIKIPQTFYELGNISEISLLKKTGYFEEYEKVDVKKIYKELKKQPGYVNDWLQWSDDQRCIPCYHFKQTVNGKYLVDYLSEKIEREMVTEFSDILEACAFYIKSHIERVRKNYLS